MAGLAPLCPCCFQRVLAWEASACPECAAKSEISQCDRCNKSRAGAFVPDDPKHPDSSGGAQRFLCVDCMQQMLDEENSSWLFNTALAAAFLVVAIVRQVHQGFVYALLAVTAWCGATWFLAARRRSAPNKLRDATWARFRKAIDKAVAKRPGPRVS
jgi:hypothetical protein